LGTITIDNGLAASTPAAGNIILYSKTSDKRLYYKDDAGVEVGPLSAGTGTVTNTGTLTDNALIVGTGGVDVEALASLGTTTTVLHGNAAGLPTFGAVALATDVSGNLPVTNLNSGTSASATTFWRGDATWATPAGGSGITLGTPQASTSGTSIDFTGIPSGTKRILINLFGVSVNANTEIAFQLGDAGGIETSGYLGASSQLVATVTTSLFTSFFRTTSADSAAVYHGTVILNLENTSNNTWCCMSNLARSDSGQVLVFAGTKATSAVLDRVRITTANGTATFDAGEINIQYE
jgi:hypothetical protein